MDKVAQGKNTHENLGLVLVVQADVLKKIPFVASYYQGMQNTLRTSASSGAKLIGWSLPIRLDRYHSRLGQAFLDGHRSEWMEERAMDWRKEHMKYV